jgi:hypothetical protein
MSRQICFVPRPGNGELVKAEAERKTAESHHMKVSMGWVINEAIEFYFANGGTAPESGAGKVAKLETSECKHNSV